MPMYEYACRECGKSFDKLVKSMSSESAVECPECGSTQTARKLSVFAVGAEGARSSAPASVPGSCRCGGPGPCGMN